MSIAALHTFPGKENPVFTVGLGPWIAGCLRWPNCQDEGESEKRAHQ
jgi:hypothetical protein